jgi:NAD(P)-dependent dehydrogenase (short-subunit alcohol dehydrogenase family)
MAQIAGRGAIVTGAAGGMGRAIAARFVAEGAGVVLVDSAAEGLHDLAASLGASAVAVAGDVSNPDDVQRIVAAAAHSFESLDIVVNCAAIVRGGTLSDLSLEEWELVTRVNVTGTFLVCQAASQAMIRQSSGGGHSRAIVNIASIEGRVVVASTGRPSVHYAASKAAVEMMTRSLAVELAPYRIRVNAVCPGLIDTPMAAGIFADPERTEWFLSRIPLHRAGKPEEIASAVLFLSSSEAEYITGETLVVDGGWLVQ